MLPVSYTPSKLQPPKLQPTDHQNRPVQPVRFGDAGTTLLSIAAFAAIGEAWCYFVHKHHLVSFSKQSDGTRSLLIGHKAERPEQSQAYIEIANPFSRKTPPKKD